ncbi:MAG: hypothetical protein IJ124_14670 [Clostridia bacterium]|nr:hypothetical protein [Clostridia bacterium]
MTGNQKKVIADNLRAFIHNFGPVRIESADYGGGFYVFYPENDNSGSWVYFAENIHNLNGWLYGNVQAVHQILPRKKRAGIVAEIDKEGY